MRKLVNINRILILTFAVLAIFLNDSSILAAGNIAQNVDLEHTPAEIKRRLGSTFKVYRVDNYIIATDLNEDTAYYAIEGVLRNCKRVLENQFFDKRANDIVTVYVFKDTKSYYKGLKDMLNMTPISIYGHYKHSGRHIAVNYASGPGTIVHELTHSLMSVDFPEAPIWISEGLASLYEMCEVVDGRLLGHQSFRLEKLHEAIRKNRTTPLKLLFKSSTKDFRMRRENLHYAQSRYFCKYLQDRGLLERVYKAFRDNHEKSNSGIRIVEIAFGKKIDEIEKDWIEWVKQQEWKGKGYY